MNTVYFILMLRGVFMKRLLSLFLVLVMLCTCVIMSGAASPAVSVSSNKTAVNIGDTVTVSVKLSSGSALGAIDLTVKYNADEFEYVSGSANGGGVFTMENIVDSKAGIIRYLGVSDSVVNGGGTLASFKLKVLKYGGKISVSVGEAIDGNDKDVTSTVSLSGTTLKCAHSKINWKVTEKATCTKKGVESGACPCGYTDTREIPKTEHTVGKYTVTKEPTCTEKGERKAVCTVCNKEYTEEIKATGHTYGKWVVEKEATETEKGLKKAECTACGEVKEQIIPVISKETEASTEKPTESTTESTDVEDITDEPTTEEGTTKAPEKQEPVDNEENKPSTAKTVVLTILATLGIEAIIGAIIILIIKQRKKEQ